MRLDQPIAGPGLGLGSRGDGGGREERGWEAEWERRGAVGVRGGGQGFGVLEEAVVAGQGVGGYGVGAGGTGGLEEVEERTRASRLEERPRTEGGQMCSDTVGRISKDVGFSPTGQGRGVGMGKVQPGG